MLRPRLLEGAPVALRRLVLALCAMEFLEWMGGGAVAPLLPTYLRQNGSTPALIGLVMGSYFAAGMVTQLPLGRLCDRLGPRPVVLGGLVFFVVGCVGFALVPNAYAGIGFRALQGMGAGSVTVAGAATIGYAVPLEQRGSAFAALYAAQTLALSIGPLAGSAVGASSMRWLFIAAAIAATGASIPALFSLPHGRLGAGTPRRHVRLPVNAGVIGAAAVFVATGALGGLYEGCWSLLLRLRGATTLDIGLSWTLYFLPFTLLSLRAGRLADRADRKVLAATSICVSAVFCCLYPFLHSAIALVLVGGLEAIGAVLVTPAALSVLSQSVPNGEQGAAQGFVGTTRTGANAVGAAGCGALFGLSASLPFVVTAAFLVVLALAVVWLWRSVPGRVEDGEIRRQQAIGAAGASGAVIGPSTTATG